MHYPSIDPVIVWLGPVAVRWYGLAYLVGFACVWWLGRYRARRDDRWNDEMLSDLVFFGALGAVLGGRIGYTFFYGYEQLARDPLFLFRIWEGGMSFHGGLLGVLVAMWLFGRKYRLAFLDVTDFLAPLAPIGLGLGRLGNFINTELPGRITDGPFGFYYPCAADAVRAINPLCTGAFETFARHPSPLYQAFTEGLLLFVLVWLVSASPRPQGLVSGVFMVGYGCFRFTTEFFREPDSHIGVFFGAVSMGQLLSVPMVAIGVWLIWRSRNQPSVVPAG